MPSDTPSLVDQFYDGVLSPQNWTQAMQALGARVDAYAFHHLTIRRDDQTVEDVASAMSGTPSPPEKLLDYATHFAALDVRFPVSWGLREGQLMLDHEHFSHATFERTPIYADFLASVDIRHTAIIPVHDGEHTRDFLGLMRHADQRPYGSSERALLTELMPHLLRANRLRHASGKLAAEAALGHAALDTMRHCVAVLGPQCHVRYLNATAERMLGNSAAPLKGLAVVHGRLRSARPDTQEQLARHVAAACGTGGTPRTAGVLRTEDGTALQVLPLQANHPLVAAWQAVPLALMTWRSTDEAAAARAAQLRAALGLSATEARLALHLAEGRTIKDFSQARAGSWHTARTHAKNLLRKTGCSRQAELVQLVQALLAR